MAVPETSPPVRVAQNTMHMLAQTLVPGDGIHRAVRGNFRHVSSSEVVLAKGTSLALASTTDDGVVKTRHRQPVHATILDLQVLRGCHSQGAEQVSIEVVTLAFSVWW